MIYKNSLKSLYSLKKKKGRLKSAGCFLGFQTTSKAACTHKLSAKYFPPGIRIDFKLGFKLQT